MPYSQNGYSVIEREDCKFYEIAGIDIPLRPDACGEILARFLRGYHTKVEYLRAGETFGHAKRQIAGTDEWSNHSSGTAVDCNATQHAYGRENTFTATELRNLRELLSEFDDILRWGGDYRGTADEMHFEVVGTYEEVKALSSALARERTVHLWRLLPGKRNVDVYMVKRALKRRGYFGGKMNNYFGIGLIKAYKKWQRSLGYSGVDADGIPGPTSLRALGFEVVETR